MASIDDIWDTPVTPNSPRHLDTDDDDLERIRPLKRQKQALFLSDSEGEGGDGTSSGMRRSVVKAPPLVADPEIDDDLEAMFADAENDEGLSFKKIGDLDVAAMEREAEERHRRPLTPHPIMPSSSPARDNSNFGNGAGDSKNDKGKGKDNKKRARPVPLNESLLLGPTGFPDLISQVKDFKIKGKGREAEDLTRLMRVYNFWTHKLHPKLKFRDTVARIEKLCHTKRIQVALSVWRDEAHGKAREIEGGLSLDSDSDDNNASVRNESSRNATSSAANTPHSLPSGPETDHDRLSLPPSSRASSQPLTTEFPDDDDLFGPSTSSHSKLYGISTKSASAAAKKRIIVDDDDEEESLWKDLEAAQTLQPTQQQSSKSQPVPKQSIDDLDDAEMWVALGEITDQSLGKTASGNAPTISKVGEMDIDDEDMWDIIAENEKSVPAHQPVTKDSTALASRSTEDSSRRKLVAESEMDWDDMYAD